jgi:hypothetical protein
VENLIPNIFEFIGASAIYAPLTLAFVWFIRWTLKGSTLKHSYQMVISCLIPSAVLLVLSIPRFDASRDIVGILEEQAWIVVWFFVGLIAWRPKPQSEADANDPETNRDAVLSKCDLSMARDEIIDFHKIINQQGEAEAGAYYFRKEYVKAWEAFPVITRPLRMHTCSWKSRRLCSDTLKIALRAQVSISRWRS